MTAAAGIWRRTQFALLALLGSSCLAVAAAVDLARKPIANNVVASELRKRGVQATYTLDRIGLRTQRVSNLVIGDPANPDLTARVAQVADAAQMERQRRVLPDRGARRAPQGPAASAARSAGARSTNCCRRRAASRSRLPNIVVDVADTTIALAHALRAGSASRSRAAAIWPAGSRAGWRRRRRGSRRAPAGSSSCARMSRSRSIARRPQVVGPVGAQGFACPASRLALSEPRMEVDSSFSEAFGSFDGKGRLTMTSLDRRGQRPRRGQQPADLQGHADRHRRRASTSRAAGAAGRHPGRPHAIRRPLPARRAARRADAGRPIMAPRASSWRRR